MSPGRKKPTSRKGSPAGSRKGAPAAKKGAGRTAGAKQGGGKHPTGSAPPARARGSRGGSGGARRAASPRSTGRPPVADAGRRRQASDRELGGDQVEGRQAVRELLLAGRRKVREIQVEAGLPAADILDDITELAADARVPVYEVTTAKLRSLAKTDAPQGVVARAQPLEEVDLDALATPRRGHPPFLLVFDGVTDPGNLGAALRSAEGAGVSGVVLPRHRAAHITPTVTKAAAGAIEHLPMALVGGVPAAIAQLRDLGVWVVGLDMAGDRTVHDLAMGSDPVALVLGAEGSGLSRLARERCDVLARIPLRGTLSSLNVGAATAVACFEVARQRDQTASRSGPSGGD